MAIQFLCDNCRRKIEVDDQYQGQEAQCPYCESIVQVLAPPPPPVARAVPEQPSFEPNYTPPVPPPPANPEAASLLTYQKEQRARRARTLAWASLLIGTVGTILLVMAFAALSSEMTTFFGDDIESLGPADMEAFQEHLQNSDDIALLAFAPLGGMLASLIAFVLGIISLTSKPSGNVLGWLGTLVAGGWVLLLVIAFLGQALLGG